MPLPAMGARVSFLQSAKRIPANPANYVQYVHIPFFEIKISRSGSLILPGTIVSSKSLRGVEKKMSLEALTDAELRLKFAEHNYLVGPVTKTTRNTLIAKLRELIIKGESSRREGIPLVHNERNGQSKNVRKPTLLFFDLETSGLEIDCDVLQIAVKGQTSEFNRYIEPTKPINPFATTINKLHIRDSKLYRNDEIVDAKPKRAVLLELLQYLRSFDNRCVLVAHNAPFDASRLITLVKKEGLVKEFSAVIEGFCDTLAMFREKYPEQRWIKGALTLSTLAEKISLSSEDAHDAAYDVFLLENVAFYHFTEDLMLSKKQSFSKALRDQVRLTGASKSES